MLNNQNIVVLALASWRGEYLKATVALLRPLSRDNRVLYVDYPRTWLDIFRGLLGRKDIPFASVFGWESRLTQPQPESHANLWLLTLPPVLPIRFLPSGSLYELGKKINAWIVARYVRKAMSTLDMEAPVVINAFQPGLGSAIKGKLDEQLTVYYCYDQIAAAAWCRTHGPKDEERYLREVDLVVTTSDALWEEKERKTAQCYLVHNGVDYPNFASIDRMKTRVEAGEEWECVAGFVGVMDDRMDIPLLEEMAASNPRMRLDLVGPVVHPPVREALERFGNVRFLGSAAPSEVPARMAAFDVGIIPFAQTLFTEFVYPMKVNEYLAAGLPVVMTPFAKLPSLEKAVVFASDAEAFSNAIRQAKERDNEDLQQQRRAYARINSWDARSAHLSRIIHSNLTSRAAA